MSARSRRTLRPNPRNDEIALIERCQAGDIRAQAEFYETYGPTILGWCNRFRDGFRRRGLDPADGAHEVLLQVFDGKSPPRGDGPVERWLFVVTRNAAFKRRRILDTLLEFLPEVPEIGAKAPLVQDVLLAEHLEAAMARLPLAQREVLILYDLENRPAGEVARILDVNEGTVRSRVATARRKVQESLRRAGITLESWERGT